MPLTDEQHRIPSYKTPKSLPLTAQRLKKNAGTESFFSNRAKRGQSACAKGGIIFFKTGKPSRRKGTAEGKKTCSRRPEQGRPRPLSINW